MAGPHQGNLFSDSLSEESILADTPAGTWEQDAAKRALDELFTLTYQYKSSKSFHELLQFVARFRFYSPFNAMLVHVQMPGARFVAPPYRWLRDYERRIKPGARPLVILQPMGPVMFVFDVSDTEPIKGARPLPPEVDRPFEVIKGRIGGRLKLVTDNAKRDGVRVTESPAGSQSAGSIQQVPSAVRESQLFQDGVDKYRNPVFINIPIRYDLIINSKLTSEAQYVTMVHELAYLYCGHLGTPNDRWWPDRRGLNHAVCEFEAESVAYLVCTRLNIDNPSAQYLSGYVGKHEQVPPISLECVMKAAGLIETMSRQKMKPRKPLKKEAGG
ncbi:MAG: hypothetical protein IBX64_10835 [Actinobacteria bacterium]|nr:hypothetical protein [Actinomycetota bacterium]